MLALAGMPRFSADAEMIRRPPTMPAVLPLANDSLPGWPWHSRLAEHASRRHAVPMPKQPHMGECRSAFQPR